MEAKLYLRRCMIGTGSFLIASFALAALSGLLHAGVIQVAAATSADELRVCAVGCPHTFIQAAVDAAQPGDVIKVSQGTYTDMHARGGVTQVVYISKTVTIQGGYTATNWITPYPITQPTKLDAQEMGRVLVITGAITATVEGLHISRGDATGLGGWYWGNAGGGVYVFEAAATISNCLIYSSTANMTTDDIGGGLYLYDSDATLNANVVMSNMASGGGGILLHHSDATLNRNIVTANTSNYNGGGVFLYFSDSAALSGNIVISNTAGWHGGGLFLYQSDAALINNVVAGNQAKRTGSGMHVRASSPRLLHTTMTRNLGGDGSGVHIDHWSGSYSSVALTNTIITGHQAGITVTAGNTATLDSTLWHANVLTMSGNVSHANDHSGEPAFAADGYHLTFGSAAMDKGVDIGVTTDVDSECRPVGRPDLGADEVWAEYVHLPLVSRSH